MNTRRSRSWGLTVALAGVLAAPAPAAPLALDNVSAATAAAQLKAHYGVDIVLRAHFARNATWATLDADAPGARLQAVSALAYALGAEFTKEYVIRKAAGGDDALVPQVDSTGNLPPLQGALPARKAIALVAGVDDASVRYGDDVEGTVSLSPGLTVAQAAAEIAKQTHTRWTTVYMLTPRAWAHDLGGTIIGRTDSGSPIVELQYVYYPRPKTGAERQYDMEVAQREQQAETARQQVAQQLATQQQLAQQQAPGNNLAMNMNGNMNGMGYSANGYSPYGNASPYGTYNPSGGYNPYGNSAPYGGNGYGSTGAYSPGSGLIILNGGGNGNMPPYYGRTGY